MIEVLVNGANGKMGQTVCKILEKTEAYNEFMHVIYSGHCQTHYTFFP